MYADVVKVIKRRLLRGMKLKDTLKNECIHIVSTIKPKDVAIVTG